MTRAAPRRPAPARRGRRPAVLERPDGARADGDGVAGRARLRAGRASSVDLPSAASARSTLERLEELARRGARRGRGRAGAAAACAGYETLRELDLPIMLLIGGATGTGSRPSRPRSRYRLGITRVTSTDFVRQTMRAFLSQRVHAVDPLLELRRGTASTTSAAIDVAASSTRPGTCCRRRAAIDRALHGGLVDGARGRPPRSRDAAGRVEGALVVHVRPRDRETRRCTGAFPGARRGVRRRPRGAEVPRRARRHPPDPGATSSSRARRTACRWSRTAASSGRSRR